MTNHYPEAFIGQDMEGDHCIYVQWIHLKTGKIARPLSEYELLKLLQDNSILRMSEADTKRSERNSPRNVE